MATPDSGEDLFKRGYELYQAGEDHMATPFLQQAADHGHVEAAYLLGWIYTYRYPYTDRAEWNCVHLMALKLFHSIPNHPLALYELGKIYSIIFTSDVVERNCPKAKEYFDQVIERFSTPLPWTQPVAGSMEVPRSGSKNPSKIEAEAVARSSIHLSSLYLVGDGVSKDVPKAIQLYVAGCRYAQIAHIADWYLMKLDQIRRLASNEFVNYFIGVLDEVETLRQENKALRTELDYRPDGPGYHQAQEEFYALAEKSSQS